MANDEDLRLNTISRFSKNSPRLALEEHGHCEVPAGCGGVVMRWYNPEAALPILFSVYVIKPARVFLNGEPLRCARPLVPRGRVALVMEFDEVAPSQGLFMLAGSRAQGYDDSKISTVIMRSGSDKSWRFTVEPPPEGWKFPDYDDSQWRELVEQVLPQPPENEYARVHAYKRLLELQAKPLGFPDRALKALRFGWSRTVSTRAWIRTTFTNEATP